MRTRLAAVALLVLVTGGSLMTCSAQTQAQTTPTPGVQTITVTLTDTTVTASQTTVQPGVRSHFVVTNQGKFPHQFWLTPQGMAQMMRQMPMEQWQQQLLYTSQTIGPSMMASFDYTFTMPMVQRQLAFTCYTPSGYAAGGPNLIELPIRVNP
jgi:uncharacterized cupredoxin-like copper-binding protein